MHKNNVDLSMNINKEEAKMKNNDNNVEILLNKTNKEEGIKMLNIYRFTNREIGVDELFELLGELTHEQLLKLEVNCHEAFEDSLMFGDEETTPGYERIGDVFEIIEQIIDSKVCYLDSYYFDELLFDNDDNHEKWMLDNFEFVDETIYLD